MTAIPTPSPAGDERCGPKVAVRLPVLGSRPPGKPVAKSKVGKWRAAVLITIHLAFAAHIAYWLTGRDGSLRTTVTPVEPSESMSTLELGLVNAGFVFFAVAILSTLLFGRFFCGWGCHIVALQDACGWAMKKLGVHPKPFRSRLLLWAPLLLALYMFIWPTFRREALVPLIGEDIDRDGSKATLVTGLRESLLQRDLNGDGRIARPGEPGDFVPGVSEAALNRDLNGNGTKTDTLPEYHEFPLWLGLSGPPPKFQKHFLTQDFWATFASWPIAIPFLAICGFATVYFMGAKAYCSYGCPYGGFFAPIDRLSPFRIRVNDNCNQCGHCTAVCTSNVRVHEEVRDYGAVVDPGCMKCLDCISVCPTDALRVGPGAPAIFTTPRDPGSSQLAKAREHAQKRYDLTLREELAIGAMFLLFFSGYRGMYGLVPLLMAMGIAMIVAFMVFKSWRLLRDQNVRAPFWQLKRGGKLLPAGVVFLAATCLLAGVGLQGLVIKLAFWSGDAVAARLQRTDAAWQAAGKPYQIGARDRADAKSAIDAITLAGGVRDGGIAFYTTPAQHERLVLLYSFTGENDKAERHLVTLMHATEPGPQWTGSLIAYLDARKAPLDEREPILTSLLHKWPANDTLRRALADNHLRAGRPDAAIALYNDRLKQAPRDAVAIASAAVLRLNLQPPRTAEAITMLRDALKQNPDSPTLREALAQALAVSGDLPQAATELFATIQREPTPQRWYLLSRLYRSLGRAADAADAEEKARALFANGGGAASVDSAAPQDATPSATR